MNTPHVKVTPDTAFPRDHSTDAWDQECARARDEFDQRVKAGEVDDLELFMVEHAEGKPLSLRQRSARMADEEDAVSDLAWEPDEDETS